MRQIEIEVNGKKRTVTLEQLQTLVSRRFIKPDATAWVDDEELKVAELINRPSTGEKPNGMGTPIDQTAKPETSEVPPLRAETIDFRKVDVPVPQSAAPKKSRKVIVAVIVGLIVVVAAIAVIAICYSGGSRKSKPTVELEVKPSIPKSEVENKEEKTHQATDFSNEVENQFNESESEEIDDVEVDSSEDEEQDDDEPLAWIWEPFDRNWDSIPESFVGSLCPLLLYRTSNRYDEVEKQFKQGEFETLAEFHSRIEREGEEMERSVISGNVHFGSTVAFPLVNDIMFGIIYEVCSSQDFVPRDRIGSFIGMLSQLDSIHSTLNTKYDPDRRSLTLSIDFKSKRVKEAERKSLLIPLCGNIKSEKYTAVNGFNAKFEVSKLVANDFGICVEFDNPLDLQKLFTHPMEIDGQIHSFAQVNEPSFVLNDVPLEFAKEMKGRISGYCVCDVRFKKPYYHRTYIEPKFSSPNELELFEYYMFVENLEFWFYDEMSRSVVAKFSLEEAFSGKAKNFADAKIISGRGLSEMKTAVHKGEGKIDKAEHRGTLGVMSLYDEEITDVAEPVPTWEEVLNESVDSAESWESKKPTLTIPDDAKSLEEALSKSSRGDVILVRSTEKPILLKGKKAARGESSEVLIDHAVAVVGESNAIVEIDAEETLRIDSRDLVAFKGLSFSARKSPSANSVKPLIAVANDSKVKFKDCEFQGNDIEETTGVAVEGEFANVSFWKCQFQQFGDSGVRVQDSANATLEYCQFLSKNRYGVSSFSGAAIKVDKCRFDGNVTGFIAEGGGGVVASNSFFSGNRSNWSISSGSKDASDTKEGNVIEK